VLERSSIPAGAGGAEHPSAAAVAAHANTIAFLAPQASVIIVFLRRRQPGSGAKEMPMRGHPPTARKVAAPSRRQAAGSNRSWLSTLDRFDQAGAAATLTQ
jgi:hypothetical protein